MSNNEYRIMSNKRTIIKTTSISFIFLEYSNIYHLYQLIMFSCKDGGTALHWASEGGQLGRSDQFAKPRSVPHCTKQASHNKTRRQTYYTTRCRQVK